MSPDSTRGKTFGRNDVGRQELQTSTKCISRPLNSSTPNKSLGTGPLGDRGQSPAPSAWSPGCARAHRAPSHRASRALPQRVEFTRDSRGPAGRRADRQTPRCRAVSGCARVCESKEGRAYSSHPLTLLRSPGSPERGSHESAHVAPEPHGVLGSLPRALVRVYAPSLRFKQGTFTCSGTPKNCMQNRLFKCCFFFLSWCRGSPFLKSASQWDPHSPKG